MPMEYFEQRERALLGNRFDVLYAAPQETAERGVTVSALRSSPEQFAAKADFPLEASPFCKAAFVVHQPDDLKFRPGRHPYHHAGVFYSQEPSASSAAPLLGVQPGMRVLDMCAAPGGKSSQLAAALQGRGVLVSNEYVAARADILKSNLERMGVSNAVVLNESPARIADALPEFFDRVLVDAPCSGEGMFRKEPVARQQHCEALVKQCAELGAEILDCAAAVLAPGGQLVYSTCTFAPEEDEGQVAAFLQRHPEFTLADALGNVDYTFGSEGEANRTGGLPLDVGCVVSNVGTVYAIQQAIREGRPLVQRVTTVGGLVNNPGNFLVSVGTPIDTLLEACGGMQSGARMLISGGPMMGIAVPDLDQPVLKNTNAVLAMTEADAVLPEPTACIRCGRCIRHCPLRLMPSHIVAAYEAGNMERLAELKVNLCMECGCCSFGCPAHRPLVQTNKLAKAKLAAWRKAQSEKLDAKKEAVK